MPFEEKKPVPNLEVITIESDLEEMTQNVSDIVLKDDPNAQVPFLSFIKVAIDSNRNALEHPQLRKYINDKNTKFDVTVVSPFLASESGYYLAHRFKSSLAIYFTGQASMSTIDYAMGQPHNPSYLPLILFYFHAPLTFLQRLQNTLATFMFTHFAR